MGSEKPRRKASPSVIENEFLDAVEAALRSARSARRHGRGHTYRLKVGRAHRLLGYLIHKGGVAE